MDESNTRISPFTRTYTKSPFTPSLTQKSEIEFKSFVSYIENNCREVGICVFYLNPPLVELYQFTDTPLYSYTHNLLVASNPVKIISPLVITKTPLIEILTFEEEEKIINTPRSRFNDQLGIDFLKKYDGESAGIIDTQGLYLAVAAASACFLYIEESTHIKIHPKSLQIRHQQLNGFLLVDSKVLFQCGIFSHKRSTADPSIPSNENVDSSLFITLDRTFTTSGSRFLRTNLASPPSDPSIINQRQEFAKELLESNHLEKICEVFKDLRDFDDIISFLVTTNDNEKSLSSALNCCVHLQYDLHLIESLSSILFPLHSALAIELFRNIKNTDYLAIENFLNQFLEVASPIATAQVGFTEEDILVFALKENMLTSLDITRRIYLDTRTKIMNYPKHLSDKYSIPFSLKFNKTRGYYLALPKSATHPLFIESDIGISVPSEFVFVTQTQKNVCGSTFDLLALNKRSQTAHDDCIKISISFLNQKIDNLRKFLPSIYKLSESLALIDFIISIALVAKDNADYNFPTISHYEPLCLTKMRHPILERVLETRQAMHLSNIYNFNCPCFVPNDICMSRAKRLAVLNGVNMSGKSTLLHTIALVVVMAHCGMSIPAEKACIPIFEKVFIRAGTSNSIDNVSSFEMEMKETAHILFESNKKTLVLLDEPCVGTSVMDGVSLSWAILENFLASGCYLLCATHYRELSQFPNVYPQTCSYTMKAVPRMGGYTFYYQIIEGEKLEECYGIDIAKDYLPEEVIEKAKDVFNRIQGTKKKTVFQKPSGKHALFSLLHRLLVLEYRSAPGDLTQEFLRLSAKWRVNKEPVPEEQISFFEIY